MARTTASFADPGQTYDVTFDSGYTRKRWCSESLVVRSLESIQHFGGILDAQVIDWDSPPGPDRLKVTLSDNRTAQYDFSVRGNPEHSKKSGYTLTLTGAWSEQDVATLEELKNYLLSMNDSYLVNTLRWRAR